MPFDQYSIHDAGSDPHGGTKQEIFKGATGGRAVKALDAASVSLRAGAVYELDPYTVGVDESIAHNLDGHPDIIDWYLECGTAQGGYAAGDRAWVVTGNLTVSADGSMVYVSTRGGVNTPAPINRTDGDDAVFSINAASWKLVVRAFRYL